MKKTYDVLCIPPQDKPIYLVVEAYLPDDPETTSYHYEERACPSDLFTGLKCEAVIIGGDTDPHGLIEYVRTMSHPDFLDRAHSPQEEWRKVLPEAYE